MRRSTTFLGPAGAWLILVLSLFVFFRSVHPRVFFNSDILTFPVLFQDLFVDGFNLSRWSISLHPDFIPDVLLYFSLNSALSNPHASILIMAVLQLLGLIGVFIFFGKQIEGEIKSSTTGAAVIAGAFVTLLAHFGVARNQFQHVFQMNQHTGTLVVALFAGAALTGTLGRCDWNRKHWVGLAALCVAAFVSNKIFAAFFIAPWTATVILLWMSGWVSRKEAVRHLKFVGAVILVTVPIMAGVRILGLMTPAARVTSILDPESMRNFIRDIGIFFRPVALPLTAYFIAWGVILLSFLKRRMLPPIPARHSSESPRARALVTFAAFCLSLAASAILMGFLVSKHVDTHSFRRSIAAPVVAVFSGAVLLSLLYGDAAARERWKLRWAPHLMAAAAVGLVSLGFTSPRSDYFGYYPEPLRCIDALSRKYPLRYGLADYWEAKSNTFLSRERLRIHSINSAGLPNPHAANAAWYFESLEDRAVAPRFTFILARNLNERALIKRFGEPDWIEECPGTRVLGYSRERSISFSADSPR